MKQFWLMKSEPDVYSIDDLKRDKSTGWSGVRNYQARNFMQAMQLGDEVLFYHSNATPPGIAGVAKVTKLAYQDPTQFDSKSEYFDAGAKVAAPRWFQVDVGFQKKFLHVVSLETMKNDPALAEMLVIRKGQRLSVQPVSAVHFTHIVKTGR